MVFRAIKINIISRNIFERFYDILFQWNSIVMDKRSRKLYYRNLRFIFYVKINIVYFICEIMAYRISKYLFLIES